jgi:hypothetical protein
MKAMVTDDNNDSGMVTVVTNLVSNDNSIQIQHNVWWTTTTVTVLSKEREKKTYFIHYCNGLLLCPITFSPFITMQHAHFCCMQ